MAAQLPPNLNLEDKIMKNTIPFDVFGEKKDLHFKIKDIRALERALGKPIQLIYKSVDVGVEFCCAAYPILLNITEEEFEEKLEKYLEEGTGSIDRLAEPAVSALSITGAMGEFYVDLAKAKYYPKEKDTKEGANEKNVEATDN